MADQTEDSEYSGNSQLADSTSSMATSTRQPVATSHSTVTSSQHSTGKRNILQRNVSSSSSAPTTNTGTTSSNNTEELEEREKCFGTLPEYDIPQYTSSIHPQAPVGSRSLFRPVPPLLTPLVSETCLNVVEPSSSKHSFVRADSHSKTVTILDETYTLLRTIGKGNFAVVRLAYHNLLKVKVAVKMVKKSSLGAEDWKRLSREMRAIQHFRHPHIIQLYQILERPEDICLVMEYAACGEILDYIQCYGAFNEMNARELFWQLLSAVYYIHSKGVVHRDLKAENILLDKHLRVKLTDFGFCNFLEAQKQSNDPLIPTACLMRTHCGSPQYASPEVYREEDYDGVMADIWSLGVVLYIMLCADFPFPGNSVGEIRARVLRGLIRVPYYISEDCSKLLHGMLMVDTKRRFKIDTIMQTCWMRGSPHLDKHLARIQKYSPAYEWLSHSPFETEHSICQPCFDPKIHFMCVQLLRSTGLELSHFHMKSSHHRHSFDKEHAAYELALHRIRQEKIRRRRRHKKDVSVEQLSSSILTSSSTQAEMKKSDSDSPSRSDSGSDLVSSNSNLSISSSSSTSLGEELLLLTDSEGEDKQKSNSIGKEEQKRISAHVYQTENFLTAHRMEEDLKAFTVNKSFPTYYVARASRGAASSFGHKGRGLSLKRQHTADDLSYDIERMTITSSVNSANPSTGSRIKMIDFRRASEGDEHKLIEFQERLLHQGGAKRGRLCRDSQSTRTIPLNMGGRDGANTSGFSRGNAEQSMSTFYQFLAVTSPSSELYLLKETETNVPSGSPYSSLNVTSPKLQLKSSQEPLYELQYPALPEANSRRHGQDQLVQKWWMNRYQTSYQTSAQSPTLSFEEATCYQPQMTRSPSEEMDLANYHVQKRFSLPSGVVRRHSQTMKTLRPSRVLEAEEEEAHSSAVLQASENEKESTKPVSNSLSSYTSRRSSDLLHHARGFPLSQRTSEYHRTAFEVKDILMELEMTTTDSDDCNYAMDGSKSRSYLSVNPSSSSTLPMMTTSARDSYNRRIRHPVVVVTEIDGVSGDVNKTVPSCLTTSSPYPTLPPPFTSSSNLPYPASMFAAGIPPSASQMSSLSTTSNMANLVACALPFSPSFSSSVDADSGLSSSYLLTEHWLNHRASTATTGTGFSSCDMGYQSRRASPTQQLLDPSLSGKYGGFSSKRSSYSSIGGVNPFPLPTMTSAIAAVAVAVPNTPLKPIKRSRTRYGLGRNHPYYLSSQTAASNHLSVDQAMRRLTLSSDVSHEKYVAFSITGREQGSMGRHSLPTSTSRRHSMPCMRQRSITSAQSSNRIDSYLTLHEYLLTSNQDPTTSPHSTLPHLHHHSSNLSSKQSETNVQTAVSIFTASSSSSSSGGETRAIEMVNLQHNYQSLTERVSKTPLPVEPPRIFIEMAAEEDAPTSVVSSFTIFKEVATSD